MGFIPGYPWQAVLGKELAAKLAAHRDLDAYPGLPPFTLSNNAVVLRASEDPTAMTPEMLTALKDYFAPAFPPVRDVERHGALNPLNFTAEDLEVLYERYGRRVDNIEANWPAD